jgi:transmembrane sensor
MLNESWDSRFCHRSDEMPANDIESDAADWLIRLEGDASPQTRADFEAWLASDPRHKATFIRLQKTWNYVDIVQRLRPLDGTIDEQVIDKFGLPARLPEATTPQPRNRTRLLAAAASILLVAVGGVVWLLLERSGWQTYHTEFGGFQRVALPDGSTAMLNTDSEIRARIGSNRRQIVLVRGEALFTVAHDIRRPFDVTAADTLVRAVGTAFSVRLRDHRQVDVLVTEGHVAIDPKDDQPADKPAGAAARPTLSTLSAGETTSIRERRPLKVQRVADGDVSRKLAWTQGRILFDRTTLADAVAEFNRYNRRQLVIDDPSIADIHIGGAFQSTDLDSFVAAIQTFGIRATPMRSQGDSNTEVIRLVAAPPGQ